MSSRLYILAISLLTILIAGLFLTSLIKRVYKKNIESVSFLSLVPMAGVVMIIFLSLPVFIWGAWLGGVVNFKSIFIMITILFTLGVLALNIQTRKLYQDSHIAILVVLIVFFGLCYLRIIFIRDLVLPPYSDSVEHYLIINDLLHPENPPLAFYTIERISTRYYHFGYHAIAGWVSIMSDSPIEESMLVFGQILQAIIPVSLFFPIKKVTKSNTAGLVTILLAGLGWRMPAFASNWGKYPALTSLAILPFVIGLFLIANSTTNRKERRTLFVIAIMGGIISTLAHTRSLLLLLLALSSWWIAGKFMRTHIILKVLSLLAGLILIFWMGYQISEDTSQLFIVAPYLRDGMFSTGLVLFLVLFGIKKFPHEILSITLLLLSLIAGTLIVMPTKFQHFGYQSLLDRPFAQMSLFLPLSALGGVGFAGLIGSFNNVHTDVPNLGNKRSLLYVAVLIIVCIMTLNAFYRYSFSSSECCQLAAKNDIIAFQWIEENLPQDAIILIASNHTPSRKFGVDGGIWIMPLTGYQTEKWSHVAPMDSPVVLADICAKGTTYIYAGGTSSRFSVEVIERNPRWFERIFTLPGAYLYKIIGCTEYQ